MVEVSTQHDRIDGASVTYQRELIRCGKPRCNKWHGPYWYAYWTAGGRTRTLYIGKRLRPAAEVRTTRERPRSGTVRTRTRGNLA